jgi:proline iminopeptidase
MPGPFPEIEPFDCGYLDVGDGHLIWWERSGDPEGKPFIALHGGPGGGLSIGRRRWFDPAEYQLIQFDQRGCGRSTPSASDPFSNLSANTTHHLIGDIELLRERFGIARWFVWGASWGATLALAYAERFPERVRGMILLSVTMTRREDVHWLYHQAGRFFPEEWARFRAGAFTAGTTRAGGEGKVGSDEDLVMAYNYLLNEQPDRALRQQAADHWCAWEDAVLSLEEGWSPSARFQDPAFRMQFARLCAHYFSNGAWLDEDELLDNAKKLSGIPGVLIHGRFDIGGPPDVPWLLARAWPDAELHLVKTGHSGGAEMDQRHLAALAPFAGFGS